MNLGRNRKGFALLSSKNSTNHNRITINHDLIEINTTQWNWMPPNALHCRTQNELADVISFYAFLAERQDICLEIVGLVLLQGKDLGRERNLAVDKREK